LKQCGATVGFWEITTADKQTWHTAIRNEVIHIYQKPWAFSWEETKPKTTISPSQRIFHMESKKDPIPHSFLQETVGLQLTSGSCIIFKYGVHQYAVLVRFQ
jgi:hypothetical protein